MSGNKRVKKFDLDSIAYGKVPPQSIDLEKGILGSILLEKNAINEVRIFLSPKHFYSESHKIIYKSMLDLADINIPIDALTLVEKLKKDEQLELIGGAFYLTRLTDAVVSSANIITHARAIIEKFIFRELIRIGGETYHKAFEESADVFDLLDEANNSFYSIRHDIQKGISIDVSTIAFNYLKWRDSLSNKDNMLYTGFPEWDAINGPLFRGGVYVIAGRPGMGKTDFIIELILRMATKHDFGFISLEMTNNQIVQRCVSNMEEIDNYFLKLPKDRQPEWLDEKIHFGTQKFANLKLQIDGTPGQTIENIIAKLSYWKQKYNIKAAAIDFLQYIGADEEKSKYWNETQIINHNMSRIVIAAKELDIPIFVLCQLNRDLYKRAGTKEPTISDLKGSGKIEEFAYQIMMLHRPEYYDITEDETGESTSGLAYSIIVKHRDGKLDRIKHKFLGQFSKFRDWDSEKFEIPKSFTFSKGASPALDEDLPF